MRSTVLIVSFLTVAGLVRDAGAAAAKLESAIGIVRVRVSQGVKPVQGVKGMNLPEGTVVATGSTGRAQIRFPQGDLVRLGASTQMKVTQVPQRRGTTILTLLVGNVRAMIQRKTGGGRDAVFGIAAGSGVCAVKGTDFEVAMAKGSPPSFTVNSGDIVVGQAQGTGLGALQQALNGLAGGTIGQSLKEGFQVVVPAGKTVPKPAPAPVRTTLEVMTGTVKIIVQGQQKEVGPGEEIPAGATVVATDESAVLVGTKSAVSVQPGSQFTYDAKVEGGTVNMVIQVETGSKPVTVESGGTTAEVGGGSTLEVAQGAGQAPVFQATSGSAAVTYSDGTSQTLGTGETTTGTTGTTGGGTTTAPPPVATTDTGNLPPPPPDTTNQEVETILSPSAP